MRAPAPRVGSIEVRRRPSRRRDAPRPGTSGLRAALRESRDEPASELDPESSASTLRNREAPGRRSEGRTGTPRRSDSPGAPETP
eukprot:2084693-Alexandrium_andersonii.AAC.1